MALDPNNNIISNESWDMVDRDCNNVVDNLGFTMDCVPIQVLLYLETVNSEMPMAFLDDLDGDGMREIAISSPYMCSDENGSNPGGWVHIFSPATDNTYQFPSEAAMATAEGTTGQYSRLGYSKCWRLGWRWFDRIGC